MHIIKTNTLLVSLLKQFNTKHMSLPSDMLKNAIEKSFTGYEYTYDEIKSANGVLYLSINDNVNLKRTQLLSMIASIKDTLCY